VQAITRYTLRIWFGLVVLCLAAAVTLLHSAVLSPLLRPIGEEFGNPDATTGQLATLGSLVGFAFALSATPWMDRWSRRTWFRLEGSLIVIGCLLAALAPSFGWLALARIMSSCGSALIMANCMTGARELFCDPVWRNRAIGLILSATTVAFILGLPVLTQLEARFGWRVAIGSIALPAALLVAGTVALPPSPTIPVPATARGRPLGAFRAVLGDRRTRFLLIVFGLNVSLYSGWFVYFGAYAIEVFAVSAGVLSILFLSSGLTQLVANNVAPPLLRRSNPLHFLNVMLTAVAIALLLTGIAITTIPSALMAAVVILNGTGMAYIATSVLLLDSETSHPGAVMALAAATSSLGSALGPLVTGLALASTGSFEAAYRALGLIAPLAIVALWFGTRQRAAPPVVERALTD
jgi:MFS transporter, DHA1 family, inner membrane transport protein